MASTISTLAFQPWTRASDKETSLKDVLARVNLERGHFRDITESSLQEEIAAEGALELSESEGDENEEPDGEDEQKPKGRPTTREELFKAKFEMHAQVASAEQNILMALDFVSLLLSKDAPKQALTTISPVLKDTAPLGSLGADVWQRMPADKAREEQDALLATNVRAQGLQKSADSLLAAASRLEGNVRKETRYWDQILSISERGWNVCKIQGQQHRLGVRFGFGDSSPEFSRRSIAALHTSQDGDVTLERGIGSRPRALRATLRNRGQITGASRLPILRDYEVTTLDMRIRYARDSLFDEELYHEMIRECRTLTSLGIGMRGSAINFASESSHVQVELDLVSIDEDNNLGPDATNEEDSFAQAVVLAARLLLTQAHKDRLKKRTEVPLPLSEKKQDERSILPILRPIASFVMHRSAIEQLNAYVDFISDTLSAADIQLSGERAIFQFPGEIDVTSSETLITELMQPWVSVAAIKISPPNADEFTFRFKAETTLARGFGTLFTMVPPDRAEGYQFNSEEDLFAATDAKLASSLAYVLCKIMGGVWKCYSREALLRKDAGAEEQRQELRIEIDSKRKVLSVNSPDKHISWVAKAETLQTKFWNAPNEILL